MPFPVSTVSMMASTSAMAFYVVVLLRLGDVEGEPMVSTSALMVTTCRRASRCGGGEGAQICSRWAAPTIPKTSAAWQSWKTLHHLAKFTAMMEDGVVDGHGDDGQHLPGDDGQHLPGDDARRVDGVEKCCFGCSEDGVGSVWRLKWTNCRR